MLGLIVKPEVVEGYVVFQNQFLRIEELGGIDDKFIVFNPSDELGFPNYKIQLVSKVFIKEINSDNLINITEYNNSFQMIDATDQIIAFSDDLNPEFVAFLLDKIMKEAISDPQQDALN